MKRSALTLILSLFAVVQLTAQKQYSTQFEVQYHITSHLDSIHKKNVRNEIGFLYTGLHYGVYLGYVNAAENGLLKSDTRQKLGLDTKGHYRLGSINPSLNKTIYKSFETGDINTVNQIPMGKTYQFNEPKTLQWKIKDSIKTVQGYPVQKATTQFAGRDYVAWFTLEIPIPDGPYIFSGLPGLIVELYDLKKDYYFVLNSIQKLKTPKVFSFPKVDTISKKKFGELYKIAQKNWPDNMIAESFPPRPNRFDKSKKMIQKWHRDFKQMIERQNNPIELK